MSLEKATGAAGILELGGTLFTLQRPSTKDMGKWRAFVRKKVEEMPSPIKTMREELQYLSPRDRREMIKVMHDNLMSRRSLTSPQAREVMESTESDAYLVWLAAKPNHPDLTYEQTLELVEVADVRKVKDAMDSLMGDDEKKDGTAGEAEETSGEPKPKLSLTG